MLEVYVDGATQGNPGPSGAGVFVKGKKVKKEAQYYLGTVTNHEAELIALIRALELCHETFPDQILSIRSDSKLVVDMVEKRYIKNANFQPLLLQILQLMDKFPYCFIKWIPDQKNKNADRLARNALHTKQTII